MVDKQFSRKVTKLSNQIEQLARTCSQGHRWLQGLPASMAKLSAACIKVCGSAIVVLVLFASAQTAAADEGCVIDPMTSPITIRSLRDTGGRAFWSPDGEQLAFMENGQAYILDMGNGGERCLTCAYDNAGFERVQFLGDGSLLLIGAADEAEAALDDNIDLVGRIGGTSLWWMPADGSRAPQPLDQRVFEGVAMSPTSNDIAWTQSVLQEQSDFSTEFELRTGRIEVSDDGAALVDRTVVHSTFSIIEAQDILDNGRTMLFSSYYDLSRRVAPPENPDAEVMTVDVMTGEVTNHTNNPAYDEAEGMFHGTDIDVIESGRDTGDGYGGQLDLYALRLDGTGEDIRRLTRFAEDGPDMKANNPDVHPDGRRIAFSRARVIDDTSEATGADDGLMLLEFGCASGGAVANQPPSSGQSGGGSGASTLTLFLLAVLAAMRKSVARARERTV